jgi:hypothetical protein
LGNGNVLVIVGRLYVGGLYFDGRKSFYGNE